MLALDQKFLQKHCLVVSARKSKGIWRFCNNTSDQKMVPNMIPTQLKTTNVCMMKQY